MKQTVVRLIRKYSVLTSLLVSVTSSIVVCSLFVRAGAVSISNTGNALPYAVTLNTQAYDQNNFISGGDNLCNNYYSIDRVPGTCYAPWNRSNEQYTLDGSQYVATTYEAQCPTGQVMIGYKWGGSNSSVWGNRYAMTPRCATLTVYHK